MKKSKVKKETKVVKAAKSTEVKPAAAATSASASEAPVKVAPPKKAATAESPEGGIQFVGFNMLPEKLTIIGLDTEHKDEEHLLGDKDRIKDPVDDGMVKSVYNEGVHLPVLVRMVGKTIEVVDGRQRVRAAREANKLRVAKGFEPIMVPVIFKKLEDRDAFATMISTNEHRMDDTPLQKARKALRLLSYGYTREMVAEVFNVSPVNVANWEKIADLDHKVIEAVEKQRIPFTLAVEIAKIDRKEQVAAMDKAIADGTSANAFREENQRRRRQGHSTTTEDGEERGAKPGTKVLRRLVKAREDNEVEFDDAVCKAFRFVLGQLPARNIRGLTEALKYVGADGEA